MLWASICYRLVNKIETFALFGGIPEIEQWHCFQRFFQNVDKNKLPTKFTGAHNVCGERRYLEIMNMLTQKHTLEDYANKIYHMANAGKLEDCCKLMRGLPHVGPFFAWQVTCDLLESKCLFPCHENDYAELGPGALRKSQTFLKRTRPLSNNMTSLLYPLDGRWAKQDLCRYSSRARRNDKKEISSAMPRIHTS
jgi:hypothetical protein